MWYSGQFAYMGDLVLADRGFKIEESVGLYCAQLILPAFTRGKDRLTPYQINDTRKLASLRIHVERVIGNILRKYTILKGHLPVETASLEESAPIDKIVYVSCSLCNLSPHRVRMGIESASMLIVHRPRDTHIETGSAQSRDSEL